MKTYVLDQTGAKELSEEFANPIASQLASVFAAQLTRWGGDVSVDTLTRWLREINDMAEENTLVVIGGELYVPFEGDEATLYNLVDWLLAESPCHGLTKDGLAELTRLEIQLRS